MKNTVSEEGKWDIVIHVAWEWESLGLLNNEGLNP